MANKNSTKAASGKAAKCGKASKSKKSVKAGKPVKGAKKAIAAAKAVTPKQAAAAAKTVKGKKDAAAKAAKAAKKAKKTTKAARAKKAKGKKVVKKAKKAKGEKKAAKAGHGKAKTGHGEAKAEPTPASTAPAPAAPDPVPHKAEAEQDLRLALRAQPGFTITDADPDATPAYPGKGKQDAEKLTELVGTSLAEWQERLYADGRTAPESAKSLLVVLQGLDTAGKSGVVSHVFGLVDPQGIALAAFKQPTEEELSHHFLWRVRRRLPGPGLIGIFDRSHYEDVLVVRVDELVSRDVWEARYDEINQFEAELAASGTTIIKCFLNISKDEQKARLAERLEDPTKYWKSSPGDLVVRGKWDAYQAAYQDAITRCTTDQAPWYVIPSNKKWYRNWAIATLILEHLKDLDPQWPPATFDVAAQLEKLKEM